MIPLSYTDLITDHKYYIDIPSSPSISNERLLVQFKKYIYTVRNNIIGLFFNVIHSFTKTNNKLFYDHISQYRILYLYQFKEKIYKPLYPTLGTLDHDDDNKCSPQQCKIFVPKTELTIVNKIMRCIIGDPYFDWLYIYD